MHICKSVEKIESDTKQATELNLLLQSLAAYGNLTCKSQSGYLHRAQCTKGRAFQA